jgi:hypothetical protein
MISGFLIAKDVLKPGYPFVEAIAAALPICDEFLISDGFSTDGTYEIIEKIAELNNKVKVFRQEWPKEKSLKVLGDVTNWLRAKCKYDYIFSIQANEVVHEDSVKFIKALPEMCPETQTFSFPFIHFMRNYKFSEEFRLRFSKNLPGIIAAGDAWSLGTSKKFVRSEALHDLKHPRELYRNLGRGIQWTYANTCQNPLSRAIYLPKPIFRYWALFPINYIEKCLKHKEMFNVQNFNAIIEELQNRVDDPEFWKIATEKFKEGPLSFKYPEELGQTTTKEHPKIMQNLISNSNSKTYFVREELFNLIRKQ